jgi:hypothetical protein
MRIIITNSFKKDFLKILQFNSFIDDFILLLKTKKHKFIDLKSPYKKFKYKIWNIHLRSILFYSFENKIIPIFIAKKSDKINWKNLILDWYFEKIIEKKLKQVKTDLIKWDFKYY